MQNSNKDMRKFITKILILLSFVVIGMYICNYLTDHSFSRRHFGSFEDKLSYIKNTEGSRTIFVGGSSVLFGVNAEHYSSISGENTINMGLHAFKHYDIYFACIEPYIHDGDKIILAFEYYPYNYKWDDYDNAGLIAAHLSKSYYKLVSIKHRPAYTYGQLLYSYSKLYNELYSRTIERRIKGEEKAYLRSNINHYGDFDTALNSISENPPPYTYDLTLNKYALKEILNYISKYEDKGAKVFIVFPPIYTDQDLKDNETNILNFYNQMKDAFGDRVLGYPTDWMFNESDNFWDTGYHLISPACIEHTEYYYKLIQNASD